MIKKKRPHVTIWLDRDVVDRYRAMGPDWEERMNDVLAKGLKRASNKPAKRRTRAA